MDKTDAKLMDKLYPQHSVPNKIESPLSAFNNLLQYITKRLGNVFCDNKEPNAEFINKLIFDNNSITINCVIKIHLENDKIHFRFIGNHDINDTKMIETALIHKSEIKEIFNNYMYIVSTITGNYDKSISENYVNDLYNSLSTGKFSNEKYHAIPYKNKIQHLYDNEDKTLDLLYTRFTYLIKFNRKSSSTFSYKIQRVLSTINKESKSIENLRFEEIETIRENTVPIDKLKEFLSELFYYGEIKY